MRRYRGAARLAGVDVARALALFGMMSVHVFPPFTDDGALHPAYAVAAGRSAALFAVLAGVGLALASGGIRPPVGAGLRAARVGALARAALLLVLGLLLGEVDSPPLVILAYYAVLFAAAPPFLGLRARTLAVLAAGWALLAPVVS
ncbi:MAG: heparan-alpha-glucosaminide N-acetyltransferase domain-containing protein, partial [Actinomycetes bacterium]